MSTTIQASIFRAYDIRGVVGDTLNKHVATLIGRAIAAENLARGETSIAVARDGRLSGTDMLDALIAGLRAGGWDVEYVEIETTTVPIFTYSTLQVFLS